MVCKYVEVYVANCAHLFRGVLQMVCRYVLRCILNDM